MSKLVILALYLEALFKTLVVPCVTVPSNWQYCFNDWDKWLYPELVRGWELYTGREVPYSTEKPDTLRDNLSHEDPKWQNSRISQASRPRTW